MFQATSAIECRHAVRAARDGQIHAVVALLRSLWREQSKVICRSKISHILGHAIPLLRMCHAALEPMASIPRCGFT